MSTHDDSKVPPSEQTASQEDPLVFASRPERIVDALKKLGWLSPIEAEDKQQNLLEWCERAEKAEKAADEWEGYAREYEDKLGSIEELVDRAFAVGGTEAVDAEKVRVILRAKP